MATGDKKPVVMAADRNVANGVATLGEDALLAAAQRPKAGGLYRDNGTTTVEASLAEISTLLANKAPAGYGLGTTGASINSGKDLNDIWQCGFYSWGSGVSNAPFGYGLMVVLSPGAYADGRVQIAYDRVNKTIAIRWLNTTWSPWEYQNPPMVVGKEYRTTERYLGKPVYVKLVNVGNYPASGTKTVAHGISNVENIVSCLGTSSMGYSVNGFQYVDHLYADTANVYITVNADVSKNQVKVILKYTKTTD